AKVAGDVVFRIFSFLMADHSHRNAIQLADSANDRQVIPIAAVAMQLDKIIEYAVYVVQRCRALRMARPLNLLRSVQVAVDLICPFGMAFFRSGDLLAEIEPFFLS